MAKGKYAGIVENLPRDFGTDPGFQEKVDAIKKQILEHGESYGKELSDDVIDDLVMDITAMCAVLNDALILAIGGEIRGSKLAQIFANVRKIKSQFEAQEKVTNVLIEAYKQILVDQYEVEGVRSLGLASGGTVRIDSEPHGSVVDRDANRKWAIENGLENLLSLPWQTVNALTKKALLAGEEPPDGVEATNRPKIVYTKG
ncbi:MAG: hypothetical protein JW395_2592 [Nitrospira sp.]|nr:hypothetical protein [Nitrospira sp.]